MVVKAVQNSFVKRLAPVISWPLTLKTRNHIVAVLVTVGTVCPVLRHALKMLLKPGFPIS